MTTSPTRPTLIILISCRRFVLNSNLRSNTRSIQARYIQSSFLAVELLCFVCLVSSLLDS